MFFKRGVESKRRGVMRGRGIEILLARKKGKFCSYTGGGGGYLSKKDRKRGKEYGCNKLGSEKQRKIDG